MSTTRYNERDATVLVTPTAPLTTPLLKGAGGMADAQRISEPAYRSIEGFPGYRIGTDGSIWTAWAYNGRHPRKLTNEWKRMRPSPDGDGYLGVNLFRDGRPTRRKIHQLVLEAFVGPRPAKHMQACHDNGKESDCRLSNLRWDTPTANQRDRVKHGTSPRGIGSGKAKLSDGQVITIRDLLRTGEQKRVIATRFGVSASTISAIARGQNWAWLAHQ